MKKISLANPFTFGEWYEVSWLQSCYAYGLVYTLKERLGYGITQYIVEQEGNIHRGFASWDEWVACGKRYLDDVVADPAKLGNILVEIRDLSVRLNEFCQNLEARDVSTFSKKQQITYLEDYHRLHHELWAVGMIPNVLEFEATYFADYLKTILEAKGLQGEELGRVFQTLITPTELSAAQCEERDMLRLATHAQPDSALVMHWKKYRWIYYGWVGPALTLDYFVDVQQKLLSEGTAKERLVALQARSEELLNDKEAYAQQLHLTAKERDMFSLLEELLFMKTMRIDALVRSYCSMEQLFMRIAKDYYLSLGQIRGLYLDWIIDGLRQDKFNVDEINALIGCSVQFFDGEKMNLMVGDRAKQFIAPLKAQLPVAPETTELIGETAFPGKVVGTVRIVNQVKDMEKFEAGDILVSNVTDPSILPAMKRAAAYVTNLGGLTCHAAIVARELGVPCVIGTKVATKVFKDGDRVEVDATRGIVRKI